MKSNKFQKRLKLSVLLLANVVLIYSGFIPQAIANQNLARVNKNRVVFKPPETSKPKVTVGGASRGNERCPEDQNGLEPYVTPVIPAKAQALTTQSRPTLLVYLPATSVQQAFFSIREVNSPETNQQQHYQTILVLPQKAGIMSLNLPDNAAELQVGKTYKWSLVMMCNNRLRPDSPLVEGTIKRVALNSSLSEQLKTSRALEKVFLYGQAGLWYDTINTLAQLRYADPNNSELSTLWQELLNSESVNLKAIANQPLIK